MKITLYIIGVLAILAGTVWLLQGIGLLPGSYMSGQIQWAINGGIAIAAGIGIILFANRRLDLPH